MPLSLPEALLPEMVLPPEMDSRSDAVVVFVAAEIVSEMVLWPEEDM